MRADVKRRIFSEAPPWATYAEIVDVEDAIDRTIARVALRARQNGPTAAIIELDATDWPAWQRASLAAGDYGIRPKENSHDSV